MYNTRLMKKYLARDLGYFPKIGNKPKKGDRIHDMGTVHEIDMVSRGYAYTVPEKGSSERLPFPLKDLKPDQKNNWWEYDWGRSD